MTPSSRPRPYLRAAVIAVAIAAMSGHATADEKIYKRIPVTPGTPAPSTLSQFLAKLQRAAETGDASVILGSVSKDLRCLRDFGGVCNERMTARDKFSAMTGVIAKPAGSGQNDALVALRQLLNAQRFESTTAHGATSPILCGPAVPKFDQNLVASTKKVFGPDDDVWFNWLAVEGQEVAAYSKPSPSSSIVAKLSQELVHVDATGSDPDGWIAVDLPSGAKGHLRAADVSTLLPEQLCFTTVPSVGWQISAFVGGGD